MQKRIKRSPRTVVHNLFLTLALSLAVVCLFTSTGQYGLFADARQGEALAAVSAAKERYLIPGGMPFGIRLETEGVVVVGFTKSAVDIPSPAERAGIALGDVIRSVGDVKVEGAAGLSSLIEASGGQPLTVTLLRDGKTVTKTVTPLPDAEGHYRAGLKVRDGTAGIGTVTAIDPVTMQFVGLGHGICDSDTGVLLPLKRGTVYDVSVTAVRKGAQGAPGEIKGYFSSCECGTVLRNSQQGVQGQFQGKCFQDIQPMAVASCREVRTGKVTILCTLGDNVRREYEASIVKMTSASGKEKNFIIKVTDPELLQKTGGIVQGMSGSPIIQNGKLIGAVTHVMVADPTEGYGIFIENMLNAENIPMAKAS
ncbi:MAG: SpoIVB peptidase [Clostridia bacterium]|nr:SpoIVB peptidase [Clostridia bacterium]